MEKLYENKNWVWKGYDTKFISKSLRAKVKSTYNYTQNVTKKDNYTQKITKKSNRKREKMEAAPASNWFCEFLGLINWAADK
jgi:hypothetical protein